jgi:hypothetical protein
MSISRFHLNEASRWLQLKIFELTRLSNKIGGVSDEKGGTKVVGKLSIGREVL